MFTEQTSLIIPTKDRSDNFRKLINRIFFLKLKFEEILVVDSSNTSQSKIVKIICKENNLKYFHTKASTSFQRNFGLTKIKNNKYIMFMDDDVEFFEDTFKNMELTINSNGGNKNIAGFGFNQVENTNNNFLDTLKNKLSNTFFDIYPSGPGKIARSGWHSKILNLEKDIFADWVFTTICIYKKEDIEGYKFDETFGEYSYLEDLDFSLNLMKDKKKIYISSSAKFKHPINIDRSSFKFGIIEVINRFKIIKKYHLSKKLFFIALTLRALYSFLKSLSLKKKYFQRGLGNIYALFLLNKKNINK